MRSFAQRIWLNVCRGIASINEQIHSLKAVAEFPS